MEISNNPPLEFNLDILDSIRDLKPNWDEQNADSFSQELVNRVEDIIKKLPIQPNIFPTANNSIQLEYETNNDYLEFEIFENYMIKVFNCHSNNEESSNIIRSEYIKEKEIFPIIDEYFKQKRK